jgi:hypothetical protein
MPYKDKIYGAARAKERYHADRDRRIARQREYYSTDVRRRLLISARQRATLKNIPFTITVEDIFVPERCPLLDIPLIRGVAKLHDASPTLDRIRNDEGYVPGNVVIISYAANRAKGNLASADLLKLATRLTAMEIFGAPVR